MIENIFFILSENLSKSCFCRTYELLIGPNGKVYRCYRDLYSKEKYFKSRDRTSDEFKKYMNCKKCRLCGIKVEMDFNQEPCYVSVEISNAGFR